MSQQLPLILASTSPRRREMLEALGLGFTIQHVDVDETPQAGETPEQLVMRLAAAKADAADAASEALVLAADTVVVVGGKILGKPVGEADALGMLRNLSGRGHRVLTGVALHAPDRTRAALSATDVYFRELTDREAHAYWQSGEPRDKAGAYAIQGLGGAFVERIEGSYSGVVGLPVFETLQLLRQAGCDVFTHAGGS